jgi:hypothetical protein
MRTQAGFEFELLSHLLSHDVVIVLQELLKHCPLRFIGVIDRVDSTQAEEFGQFNRIDTVAFARVLSHPRLGGRLADYHPRHTPGEDPPDPARQL